MRISDCSSDVCSSDLRDACAWLAEAWGRKLTGVLLAVDMGLGKTFQALMFLLWLRSNSTHHKPVLIVAPTGLLKNWQAELNQHVEADLIGHVIEAFGTNLCRYRLERSEEHTHELQSLMRNSYDVFCLKKKK